MEVYNNLPEELKWYCEKMYFTHNVLPDIRNNTIKRTCGDCACHGFPCMKCAVFKYKGKLGPGYKNGNRMMFFMDISNNDAIRNMSDYLIEKPYTECKLHAYINGRWEGGKNIELPYEVSKLCVYVNGVRIGWRL